jgi:UDP-N-acetylglucosamine 2-epimerase (non-hydrolysing)
MNITIVAGARPNFIKVSALINEINNIKTQGNKISFRFVHTGQHYDNSMSGSFFNELNIPAPHLNLEVGSGTAAEQTAAIMIGFEKELLNNRPDLVIVVGDVNSTMACAITAKKLNIKLAHIESGIRSFDNSMPEEINRKLTDSITDYFFTTTQIANQNLLNEGISKNKLFLVGNIMIDTLLSNMHNFKKPSFYDEKSLISKQYFVLTLHRPNNVDNETNLRNILFEISSCSKDIKTVFAVHPRTAIVLNKLNLTFKNIIIVPQMIYFEFNFLVKNSKGVITDSGGITEETTVLNIPCLTLRDSTERPETCEIGTNELAGSNPKNIKRHLKKIISNKWKTGNVPELWDGKTSSRIMKILMSIFENNQI